MANPVEDVQRKEITGSLSMEVVRCKVNADSDYFASKFEKIDGVTVSMESGVAVDYSVEAQPVGATPNVVIVSPDTVPLYVNILIFGR